MPLDVSQPLYWDEEDVGKWLATFKKGKYAKLYGAKFADAGLTGEDLLKLKDASDLASAAGFGGKRKEAKDLRTIWQGISTLKEKTKEKNFLCCPYHEWDGPKFFAWMHSPSINLGKYAERFRKVHSGDDYGSLLQTITPEILKHKFLMESSEDRIFFFEQLGKLDNQDRDPADRGKNLLVDAFGGKGNNNMSSSMPSPKASQSCTRPAGVTKLSFGDKLGGLNFGANAVNVRGSESDRPAGRRQKDLIDGNNIDEDTPVKAARSAAPDTASDKHGGGLSALGLLNFGKGASPTHSKSRGGPKPKALSQLSFGSNDAAPRRMTSQRRASLAMLLSDEDDDDEGEGTEMDFCSDGEGGDVFNEEEPMTATQLSERNERKKYSTGTFSDSGTFQLKGSHEINEYGILSNSAAVEIRTKSYESKLESKFRKSPPRQRTSSTSSNASDSSKRKARSSSRGASDVIILAHQIIQREQLGRGAGGIVYRAIHAPTLRVVALKKVRVQDATKKAQVMTEVEGLRSNQVDLYDPLDTVAPCPCLLTFYDAYTNPQSRSVSLLLEFMDGGDLNDFTEAGKKVPEPLLANIAYRLVKGLKFLHKRKQIHRDIKPHNALMHKSGTVKISDLGIATTIKENESFAATFTGTTLYMSPERLKGLPYGCSADIWSLGLTIMTLAMGQPPIDPKGGFWTVSAAVVDKPPPRLPINGYSRELRDFCECCLKNDPKKRLTAEQLMHHAWIRTHVAEHKRQNLTSTVVRNNFMSSTRGGPTSSKKAMQELGATWSKLSSTVERQEVGGAAIKKQFLKVQEDAEAIRRFFFEKHGNNPAYEKLRPSREAIMLYIKQNGLIADPWRRKCLKLFKRAGLL